MSHLFLQQDPKVSVGNANDVSTSIPTPEQLGSFLFTHDGSGGLGKVYCAVLVAGVPTWVLAGTSSSSDAPYSRALFVDGGTATAPADATGSDEAPFKTIQAALNAVTLPDTAVIVMPGVYPENVIMPDFDRIALIGTDRSGCIIRPAVGDAIAWIPGAGFSCEAFSIENFTLNPVGGGRPLRIDATATANFATVLGQLINLDCHANGGVAVGMTFFRTGILDIQNCQVAVAGISAFNPSQIRIDENTTIEGALVYEYNRANPEPVGGRGAVTVRGVIQGLTTLSGAPNFTLASQGSLNGLLGLTLTYFTAPALAPMVSVHGTVNGGITMPLPALPAPGPDVNQVLDLTRSRIFGVCSFNIGGANRQPIIARDVVWEQTVAAQVTLGDFLDVDTRGATLVLNDTIFVATLGANTATVDRDLHAIYGAALTIPTGFSIDPPLPNALYTVNIDPANPVFVTVSAKTGAGFTLTPSASAGTVDFTVLRSN